MKIIVLLLICLNAFAGPVKLEGVENYQIVFFDPDGFSGLGASVYDYQKRKLLKSKSKFPELSFYISPEMQGKPYLRFSGYNIYEDGKLICSQGLLCTNPLFGVGAYASEGPKSVFMHIKFDKDETSQKYFVNYKNKKIFFDFTSLSGYQRVYNDGDDLVTSEGSISKRYRIYEPQSKVLDDFSKKYPDYTNKLAQYRKCANEKKLSCFFNSIEDEKRAFLNYISPLGELSPLNLSNEQLDSHFDKFKKDKKHYEILLNTLQSKSLRSYGHMDSEFEYITVCGDITWTLEGMSLRTCYVAKVNINDKKRPHSVKFHFSVLDMSKHDAI